MSKPQFDKAICRYGSPMGRRDHCDNPEATLYLFKVNMVDGDYDDGGAYWGGGEPLYCARDDDGKVQLFYRASCRTEAAHLLHEDYPDIKLFKGEPAWVPKAQRKLSVEMILKPPFVITPRLVPGLEVGGAWLHLLGVAAGREGRHVATMVFDFQNGTEYIDSTMQSGVGGFRGVVVIFDTYLTFLLAAVETYEHNVRNYGRYITPEPEAGFPRYVVEWAANHKDELECIQCEIQNEDGEAVESLIEVAA